MPWPCTFENILGGVDITVLNVAAIRTDMRTDRKRLLDNLTTPVAFLRGEAGVHSNNLMSSTSPVIPLYFMSSMRCTDMSKRRITMAKRKLDRDEAVVLYHQGWSLAQLAKK